MNFQRNFKKLKEVLSECAANGNKMAKEDLHTIEQAPIKEAVELLMSKYIWAFNK